MHIARDPTQCCEKISANAYILDLPKDVWVSPIFNVANLLHYHEPLASNTSSLASLDDSAYAYSPEENFSHPGMIDKAKDQHSKIRSLDKSQD